jgi:hypothetical protein
LLAPYRAKHVTAKETRIEVTPVTRLAVAGPLEVGATLTMATPYGVPPTGSYATGGGKLFSPPARGGITCPTLSSPPLPIIAIVCSR